MIQERIHHWPCLLGRHRQNQVTCTRTWPTGTPEVWQLYLTWKISNHISGDNEHSSNDYLSCGISVPPNQKDRVVHTVIPSSLGDTRQALMIGNRQVANIFASKTHALWPCNKTECTVTHYTQSFHFNAASALDMRMSISTAALSSLVTKLPRGMKWPTIVNCSPLSIKLKATYAQSCNSGWNRRWRGYAKWSCNHFNVIITTGALYIYILNLFPWTISDLL